MTTYTPIEMDGKMVVVENAPDKPEDDAFDYTDDVFDHIGHSEAWSEYHKDVKCCPKLPTLPEHHAYWKSKEGVKISEDSFMVVHPHPDNIRNKEPYAMPLDIYTTA